MKKLLCAILCLTMLVSVFLVPVGALTDLGADNVTISDSKSLKLACYPGNWNRHSFINLIGQNKGISGKSTITFWVRPDDTWATYYNAINFILVDSAYNGDKSTYTTATVATVKNQLSSGHNGDAYYLDGATAQVKVVAGAWHRIDMLVDFDNGTVSGYVNYTSIGSVAIPEGKTSYRAIVFQGMSNANNQKYLNADNFMVRNGCVEPKKGDVAANAGVDALVANKDNIMFFESFDNASLVGSLSYTTGTVSNHGFAVGHSLDETIGVSAQTGAMYRGVQQSAVVDGKVNVRLVGTIDSLNYKKVGFKIQLDGYKAYTDTAVNVYDSIIGANGIEETKTYSALGTYGAGYIYASTVTGFDVTKTYKLTVTPFTVDDEGNETTYTPYTVTVTNGVVDTAAN